MLLRTTSCDGGMRVDLSCDACGESYEPASVVRFSRRLTWAAARSDGWVEVAGSACGPHRCPSCAAEAGPEIALGSALAIAPRSAAARPGVSPVG
jgi:hypothetical protein